MLSSIPICFICIEFSKIDWNVFSKSFLGAMYFFFFSTLISIDNKAFLSTFPLLVRGNLSKNTKKFGTIYSGTSLEI